MIVGRRRRGERGPVERDGARAAAQLECLGELAHGARLTCQLFRSARGLLRGRGVVVGGPRHFGQGPVDLADAVALLGRVGLDVDNRGRDLRDLVCDRRKALGHQLVERNSIVGTLHGLLDHLRSVLGRFGAAQRKAANFVCHDGEAAPGVTRTGGLDSCIEG